jgi:N-acetyl-alpha-D-muramate 1-phosphate uridylyltransferase
MKAMIFAAGLGTRLKPLTDNKPKALVEVSGKPLLEWCIKRLVSHGFDEIVVNIHHFGEQIVEFLEKRTDLGAKFYISDERGFLLDTGGGLKKAATFFDAKAPFLVHNVDILSQINLTDLYNQHIRNEAIATLAVSQRKSSRELLFNLDLELCGWRNNKTKELKHTKGELSALQAFAFSGIHVIDPKIFDQITESGAFSIIDVYLRLSATNCIKAYDHTGMACVDLGKVENIESVEKKGLLDR